MTTNTCNWHVLQSLKAEAAGRGAWIVLTRDNMNDVLKEGRTMAGWMVQFSDEEEPVVWFKVLLDGCAC